MPNYLTPGVYVEEISVFPPSIAPVATAVPAFIGYTQLVTHLTTPVRLTSLLEYEELFGKAQSESISIKVTQQTLNNKPVDLKIKWDKDEPPSPDKLLYYSMQLYFANGGGPCYVYSIGDCKSTPAPLHFTNAIKELEKVDEPTLLVFPDAVGLTDAEYGSVVDEALASCKKMQDRFTLADVRKAIPGGNDELSDVTTNFRGKVNNSTVDFLKYGAAYFPYLQTSIGVSTDDNQVTLIELTQETLDEKGAIIGTGSLCTNTKLGDIKTVHSAVYATIQAFIAKAYVTLPPSGAIAGVYAQVDRTRGVWKAPAGVGLSLVLGPAINVSNDLQDDLNVDASSGKSINAIRSFFGKGTLVWGARTLAGNDNEWRYISVRRFASFVEESARKAVCNFVFEPNDANTWVKVKAMIENFLINQWRFGALTGAKPEHAFKVVVGLGQSMSADDVLNGCMKVEIHLAIVRPAEFIVLRFMQKMPEA